MKSLVMIALLSFVVLGAGAMKPTVARPAIDDISHGIIAACIEFAGPEQDCE